MTTYNMWLPQEDSGRELQHNCILGPFLAVSGFMEDHVSDTY